MTERLTVLVDTREQRPLPLEQLGVDVERTTIAEGDYALKGFEGCARIERKSSADLWGTVHGGHERFNRELARLGDVPRVALVVDDAWNVAEVATRHGADPKERLQLEAIVLALEWKARIPVRFEGTRDGAALYVVRALRSVAKDYAPEQLARCEAIARSYGPYTTARELRAASLASLFGICVQCARRPGPRPKAPGAGVCACGRKERP